MIHVLSFGFYFCDIIFRCKRETRQSLNVVCASPGISASFISWVISSRNLLYSSLEAERPPLSVCFSRVVSGEACAVWVYLLPVYSLCSSFLALSRVFYGFYNDRLYFIAVGRHFIFSLIYLYNTFIYLCYTLEEFQTGEDALPHILLVRTGSFYCQKWFQQRLSSGCKSQPSEYAFPLSNNLFNFYSTHMYSTVIVLHSLCW